MEQRSERYRHGELVFRTARPYTGINARTYAGTSAPEDAVYILAEQRFTTGHDDCAGFVELIDAEDRVIRSWKFDYPMTKRFSNPDYYDDDCLVLYLSETYGLPATGDRAPDRIARIRQMEQIYDRLSENHDPALMAQLRAYYEGGLWLADYEADERGELPKDLKRGVLSQDGIWNLLEK